MNEKALKALEYYKIIDWLTEKASSPAGKALCKDLTPMTDLEQIRHMQEQTRDALKRIIQKRNISFSGAKDVLGSLKRLEIGSSLSIQELLSICSLLENAAKVKNYSRGDRAEEAVDSLTVLFDQLSPLRSFPWRSAAVFFRRMRSAMTPAPD